MTESHVFCGDVLDIIDEIEDDYFDAIFTDPPYGLSSARNKPEKILKSWLDGEEAAGSGGFMGAAWDSVVPGPRIWREVMRVVKPGGHIMAFGGTTTVDYLTIALRLAGWEVRDAFMYFYCYGSGFPKSYNISKALDRKAGAEREVVGDNPNHRGSSQANNPYTRGLGQGGEITAPATPAATLFDGYGTALKPAYEPIVLAMKPKAGTYADNALEYGVAGLNIDGGRIPGEPIATSRSVSFGDTGSAYSGGDGEYTKWENKEGRFPANLILDEQAGQILDEQAGDDKSRFFYTAKASKAEREAGLDGMKKKNNMRVNAPRENEKKKVAVKRANHHPCVKPIDLCRYFCTMLLPPERSDDQRKILVPFSGSGSEMLGAMQAGWDFVVGIEKEEKYCEIAEQRIAYWRKKIE